ncbi:TetR family transcriptional regulator [Pontibacter ummariensis]|uniref:Transcriptional regulator, TetR family n=1 Tax=Pontibacter ummariensis TaxID=1610492 RepID=A0A239LI85_9BACT|nr:TetR/AcrR family transcriptional regulator [Pontibacter ummariensis]PRY03136.1 TetR family transcriptional regulator [Pontibacter ummariensis]SNT30387.1 transcriptional regulator, TetR family [Pontibacter ummariensis]
MKKVRERILDTAHELFYNQGYRNTGINQIIEEAEVAKASLYQHFPSKEDLCISYLEYRASRSTFREAVGTARTREEAIIKSYEYITDFLTNGHFRGCAFQNIVSEVRPQDDARILAEVKRVKSSLRAFYHRMMAEDPENITPQEKQLGDQLLVLSEGAIISYQIHQELWPVEAACAASLALLKKENKG